MSQPQDWLQRAVAAGMDRDVAHIVLQSEAERAEQANKVTSEDERTMRRSELAFLMLCAWNNVPPEKGPPEWWNHVNHSSRDAWRRVAAVAEANLAAQTRQVTAEPELLGFAKAHEAWEALLIARADWDTGSGLPMFTREIYDAFIELQSARNAAVAKATGGRS